MDVNHSKPPRPELSFGGNGLLQKYLEPVDADDDSEKNASQSALAHPPSA